MKLFRLALMGGMGFLAIGCARQNRNGSAADTAAMMPPATPSTTVDTATVVVVTVREVSPGLLAEATFRPADAQRVALTRFPNGTVLEASIDRSGNDLVYTYKIRDTGGETRTVKINARTGTVVDSIPAGRPPQ
jgi:uncharacterized membrane protein YkoI